MADREDLEEFDAQLEALEDALHGAAALTSSFALELERMGSTIDELNYDVSDLSSGMTSGLRKSLDGLVFGSMNAEEALSSLGRSMVNTVYDAAVSPVTEHVGGILGQGLGTVMNGLLPTGGGLAGGLISRQASGFARGGLASVDVVPSGAGQQEPVTRARNVQDTRPVSIVLNISTPDVEGFKRSQGQIASQINRALGRGRRYS